MGLIGRLGRLVLWLHDWFRPGLNGRGALLGFLLFEDGVTDQGKQADANPHGWVVWLAAAWRPQGMGSWLSQDNADQHEQHNDPE
jgi:hypothetical protein